MSSTSNLAAEAKPSTGEARSVPNASPSTTLMWALLVVVLIADLLDLLDGTITNIAAPAIVADLGGGSALVKWLGASYALAMGTLLVVGGRLGDRYGQRRVFLVGMAGFTLASAACGLALNPGMVIAARILQGGLGALMIPQVIAIMTKTFPRDMLAKAFAAFGPLLGLSSIAGPVVAGFLIDANVAGLGWRPVFLINIVLGGVGLLAAVSLLPRVDAAPATRVDLCGSALLGGSVFSLLYGLIQGSGEGWSFVPVACIGVAALLFAGFCWRQSTASEPLIKPTLLANRGFTAGLGVGLVFFAGLSGLVYVISLFLQTGLRYTPAHAALALLPMMVGLVLAAAVCMGLIGRLGRVLVVIGLLVTMVGSGLMLAVVAAAGIRATWWELSGALLVIGMGMGTCTGTILDIALGGVDPDEASGASGSISAIQQIAAGVGSASVTSVYFATLPAGQAHAVIVSLIVVMAITALCFVASPLLPRVAAASAEH
jgi:EmrB/QacA subfamily drug resistance transporter